MHSFFGNQLTSVQKHNTNDTKDRKMTPTCKKL